MLLSFVNLAFIFIVIFLFYALRRRFRPYVLLAASMVFIWRLNRGALIWVLSCSVLLYLCGLRIQFLLGEDRKKSARVMTVAGIIVCAASLFFLKHVSRSFPDESVLHRFILPVGFSYYIFQGISYLSDVYREELPAEKNPAILTLYMCFFPKFISGPIEKPKTFLEQIRNLDSVGLFDENRIPLAFASLLYGCFMKVVIADRLAPLTSGLLNYPHIYGSKWLFYGMLMYTMQIYCDFAGYSAIAVGVGRLFGLTLTENFHTPYFSRNIAEFWRRWHISLSGWLRDYIYIPLGGNRKGLRRKCLNLLAVFVICGMWHGAGMRFIIWGLLHGICQVVYTICRDKKPSMADRVPGIIKTAAGTVLTFSFVSFVWIFFGAPNTRFALNYILRMFTAGIGEVPMLNQELQLGVTPFVKNIPVYGIFVIILDGIMRKENLPFAEAVLKLPVWARYLLEYLMIIGIFLLGMYGPGYNAQDFMYMEY
ncbi:MAG: MBOAT family protein [Lachnospiraceae bacterium]|nr:MBOAT family protein [Lachnospiraceae bacterium]